MRYEVVCKFCGRTLFKTDDSVATILIIKTQCPNLKCKRILNLPEDAIVVLSEREKRPGIERA